MPDPFGRARAALIGVVHLPPLPGAPLAAGGGAASLGKTIARARAEATALARAGFDGVIVENLGDRPYYPDAVPPETVAAMTAVALAVRDALPARVALGINVLRNDARAALGVALAAGASFIRVNVHTGLVAADQGLIAGRAHETTRARAALGAARSVAILADVLVKHARTLSPDEVGLAVDDVTDRGLADAVIVSGPATGGAVDEERLRAGAVAARARGVRLLVGSGATARSAARLLAVAGGIIVGTALKPRGDVRRPIDAARARAFVKAART